MADPKDADAKDNRELDAFVDVDREVELSDRPIDFYDQDALDEIRRGLTPGDADG